MSETIRNPSMWANTGFNLLLGVMAIVVAFPLFLMVSVSLMPAGASNVYPPPLLPSRVTFTHYVALFTQMNMGRYLLNSTILSLSATLLSLFFNSMAGYAFAKFRFRGRDSLFRTLLAFLVIPAQVAMLPLFLFLKSLGLINTYAGVILPSMVGIFGIFLIRQYTRSVPDSLIEAARVDGAGEFQIYWTILLPLIKPILVTLAIFKFLAMWNDFLWPLIVLTDDEMYTLPVALASLSRAYVHDNELMMAGAVMTILPILAVFLSLQKYYIKGIMLGSVKE